MSPEQIGCLSSYLDSNNNCGKSVQSDLVKGTIYLIESTV